MHQNTTRALLRLRRAALDEAQRAFAASLSAEAAARERVEEAGQRIAHERQTALEPAAGDGAVEAFIAWLPQGRTALQRAQTAQDGASANVTLARAALNVAHAAAEVTAAFVDAHAASQAAVTARRRQIALDEAVRHKPG